MGFRARGRVHTAVSQYTQAESGGSGRRPPGLDDGGSIGHGSMSDADTLLWTIRRDPRLRSPITAVIRLASMPDMERLVDRLEGLTHDEPRLRSKVAGAGLLSRNPRWVEDPAFDLGNHLTRVAAPAPGTFDTVLDIASRMSMVDFDVEFPLWEATIVEGVEGSGAAIVVKVHHAVIDGVGGIGLFGRLLDIGPDPSGVDPGRKGSGGPDATGGSPGLPGEEPAGPGAVPASPASANSGGLERIVRAVTNGLARVAVPAERAVTTLAAYPLTTLRSLASTASSAVRLVAPAPTPVSPLLGARGLHRQLGVFEVSFSDLHDAALANDCSINDIFVTGILGGMRTYHEAHGVRVDHLRTLMPISIRDEDDGLTGNRFVPARIVLPLEIVDPRHRLRRVRELTGSWKRDPALSLSDVLAGVLTRLPAAVTTATFGSMLLGVDVVATNVPGPRFTTWIAGAEVEHFYAFAPTSGAAANIALTTFDQAACFGVNIDSASIPDGEVLLSCLEDGIAEVLAASGGGERAHPAGSVTSAGGVERLRSVVRIDPGPRAAAG